MSKKIKLNKKAIRRVKRPAKIAFTQYLGDFSGCGNIRVIYPSLLLNTYYNLSDRLQFESIYLNRYIPDKSFYANSLFVVMQRSSTEQQLEIIKHFKANNRNKALIYECDDDLFNIPEWNFAADFYNNKKSIIKNIMANCTGITVSTPTLKRLYSKYNKNIVVIPNHLPKFLWGDTVYKEKRSKKMRICYPGSFNHFDDKSDKGDFDKELIDFIKDTVDEYQWVFVGGIPRSLSDNPAIEKHGWQSVLNFPLFMRNLDIDLMLAPLQNNVFNKSKSNIKALEATVLGVPLLCSNIDPYFGLPGACDTTEYMIHQIQMMDKNEDLRYDIWKKQYKAVKNQLYWEENDNIIKYVDSFLKLIDMKL